MKNTDYHLHLKGYVGGYDFDSNYVDYVLAQNKDKPVNVLIDSLGGSLAKALSIASAFKAHGNVSVHFVGMNASAATIASLGAKHISMDSSAMYLVHKCSTEFFEWGSLNADQLEAVRSQCDAAIRDLNKLDNNIATMYAGKCSKPQADLLDLMRQGGWLTATEAKQWGFVDEVTDFNEPKPVLTDAVASAMAAAGIPVPDIAVENKEPLFSRFMAALLSIFGMQRENTIARHGGENAVKAVAQAQTSEAESDNSCDDNKCAIQNNEANVVSKQPEIERPMNHTLTLLGKVLGIEDFAVGEEGMTLTLEQMKTIEKAIAQRDSDNAELTEQVDALKAAPAEKSQAVVDSSQQQTPASPFEEFAGMVNSANEMFNLVP